MRCYVDTLGNLCDYRTGDIVRGASPAEATAAIEAQS
jgi:hypothetical protein